MRSRFKVGDVVKITKRVEEELGWDNCWLSEMDYTIGEECIIKQISNEGIKLEAMTYSYPPSCLELISTKQKVKFQYLTAPE